MQRKDGVRFLIGDNNKGDQQIEDEEIIFAIALRSSLYGAAATCCLTLAAGYARQADSVQGPLRTLYSARTRNYRAMAAAYENKARGAGAIAGFAGGISVADKIQREQDSDRVPPDFNRGMDDNFLPIAPAGNEVPDETGQV